MKIINVMCKHLWVLLPYEVQRLVLVPNAPPGPTLIQQVPVVLCSVCSDGVFAVISALLESKHAHTDTHVDKHYSCMLLQYMESMTTYSRWHRRHLKQQTDCISWMAFWRSVKLPHEEEKLPRMNYCSTGDSALETKRRAVEIVSKWARRQALSNRETL